MKKNQKSQFIGLDKFLLLIKDAVKEALGEGYNVEINHVIKNNSIELDGLIVLKDQECVSPNIYLNPYYEKYLAGTSLKKIAEEIIGIYRQRKENVHYANLQICYELNEMKSRIIYRLINYEKNRKLLKDVPHIPFLDLAVTFHCLVRNHENGIGTIRITNEHMKNWNIDMEYLKKVAGWNTPVLFPPVIRSINDLILELLQEDKSFSCANPNNEKYLSDKHIFGEKSNTMYVISNEKGINGASCLLYPGIIKNLANKLNSDLFILPSSIHEIIAVKADGSISKKAFQEMVVEVNRTQVPKEDILSDNVYFYSRKRNAITL